MPNWCLTKAPKLFGSNLNLKFLPQILLIMNNLTHKTLLSLLLVTTTLFSWSKDIPRGTKHSSKIISFTPPPAGAPRIYRAEVERCGYEFANDPGSSIVFQADGCVGGQIKWYNQADKSFLGQSDNNARFVREVFGDITVYATCTIFSIDPLLNLTESNPSNLAGSKYLAIPSVPPGIIPDKFEVCEGTVVTIRATINDPKYVYRWERAPNGSLFTDPFQINNDTSAVGQGSPTLKVKKSGIYFLNVLLPGCKKVTIASNQAIIKGSTPIAPTLTATDTVFCQDKGTTLKVDSTNLSAKYAWFVNGVKQDSLGMRSTVRSFNSSGNIQVFAQSNFGCVSGVSNTVKLRALNVPAKPLITSSAVGATICDEDSLSLTSSIGFKYKWNNGATIQKISNIKVAGKYSVQLIDPSGCFSKPSDTTTVIVNKLPAKPIISSSVRGAAICQGDSLTLTSSTGFKYKWNSGATTPSIRGIKTAAKYSVQVIDQNACISKPSDTTLVTIFRLPAKPVISASGPLTFCNGGSVTLTSTPNVRYIWSSKDSTRAITLRASGDFSVAVRDANNCLSPTSDISKVVVNPLPAKPTITASGPLSFCADASVVLTSSDLVNNERTRYRWSTTDSTKSLTVKTSAVLTVRVLDPRNCLSPPSDPVTTIALPLPPAPTVSADGPLTFCSRSNDDYKKANSVNLTAVSQNEVTWSTGLTARTLNLTAISSTGSFIDISRDYTATAKDLATGCVSVKSIPLVVLVKNNPDASASSIDKDGTFTLKALNFPDGADYDWRFVGDPKPLASIEATVKANRYGDYTVRRKTIFIVPAPLNTLACFSDFVKVYTFKEDPDFKGLSIYPNPSNGLLTIETLTDYTKPEITIYDLLGRLISTVTLPEIKGKVIVDLRNQPEGEYILRFKADGFDLAKRIITNR